MGAILRRPVMNFIATEMIDVQNDNFGNELEAIVVNIDGVVRGTTTIANNDSRSNSNVTVNITNIGEHLIPMEKLIFKRFGIKVRLNVDSELAAVLPFYPNKNHIFIKEYFRGNFNIDEQDKILNKSNNKKGTVDLAKAKVGGIFSEYENELYINFYNLIHVYKLSPSEITAVILHELGHIFSSVEYSNRLESANQILLDISKEINSKKKDKNFTYIYKELKSINDKVTEEDVDKMVNGNTVIAGYKWFKNIVGVVETQMSNSKYDDTSFEQMADNFASKFNYGRQLITALDKLHMVAGSDAKYRSVAIMNQFMSLLGFTVLALVSLAGFASGFIFAGVIYGILATLFFRFHGEDMIDYTYDDLKTRYKRIRSQYIEQLKNLKLSDKQTKNIITQIEDMDEIIDDTSRNKVLLRRMANLIFSKSRDAKNSIEEQMLLEDLASNDLFLKSAELKTL